MPAATRPVCSKPGSTMIQQLGKYCILEELGSGTLGTVYKAHVEGVDRPVAVRILSEAPQWNPDERTNFYRECKSLASLKHPNIAAVHDFGEDHGYTFIAMEYLRGRSLRSLIAEKAAISEEDKLSIMAQVAEGLGHAHRCGILHCEIRPGGIFIEPDGIVKVLDIGIAHRLRPFLSRRRVVFEAPVYASPELIAGRTCDERSEIFCCGIVFYELATGAHPFHDEDGNKQCERILHQPFSSAAEQFPDTHPGVWSILSTCLEKDPERRYGNMGNLAAACMKAQEEMAEESELIRMELRKALPRLRAAASGPGATAELGTLLEGIEGCVNREQAEHAPLNRLMSAMCGQSNVLTTASKPPSRVKLADSFRESTEGTGEDLRVTTAAGSSAGTLEAGRPQGLEEPLPTSPDQLPPDQAPKPQLPWALLLSKAGRLQPVIRWLMADDLLTNGLLRLKHLSQRAFAGLQNLDFRGIVRKGAWSCAVFVALTLATAVGDRTGGQLLPFNHHGRDSNASRNGAALTAGNGQDGSVRADELVRQALWLVDEGRLDEGKTLISTILKSDPENPQALAALKQAEQAADARLQDQRKSDAKGLLASATALIRAGNLRSALARIDKAERLVPDLPEIAQVRRQWRDKSSELSRLSAEKSATNQEAIRRQAAEQSWNSQAEDLFKQGKYQDSEGLAQRWLSEYPDSPQARQWQEASAQMLSLLRDFDSAAEGKKHREALEALMKAERINPLDPRLPGLRERLEVGVAAAKASLTVYRLAEAATLTLDGRRLGKDGEVEAESISIGTHIVAVQRENGQSLTLNQQFVDGQQVYLVYDTVNPSLRVMSDADRELVRARKEMRQVHRFELEHSHGPFRASCRGDLVLNLVEVGYEPSAGPHGFRAPFQSLKLKVRGRTVELFQASNNRKLQSFKARDEGTALNLKQMWERLEAMTKK